MSLKCPCGGMKYDEKTLTVDKDVLSVIPPVLPELPEPTINRVFYIGNRKAGYTEKDCNCLIEGEDSTRNQDIETLRAAIHSIRYNQVPYDTIFFLKGTYPVGNRTLVFQNYINIKGMDQFTKILYCGRSDSNLPKAPIQIQSTGYGSPFASTISDIQIVDYTGGDADYGIFIESNNCIIKNVFIDRYFFTGINLQRCNNIIIDQCDISGKKIGINFSVFSSQPTILNYNILIQNSHIGYDGGINVLANKNVSSLTINNCRLAGRVACSDLTDLVFQNNTIKGKIELNNNIYLRFNGNIVQAQAVSAPGSYEIISDNGPSIITNNIFENTTGAIISLPVASDKNIVTNNIIFTKE